MFCLDLFSLNIHPSFLKLNKFYFQEMQVSFDGRKEVYIMCISSFRMSAIFLSCSSSKGLYQSYL